MLIPGKDTCGDLTHPHLSSAEVSRDPPHYPWTLNITNSSIRVSTLLFKEAHVPGVDPDVYRICHCQSDSLTNCDGVSGFKQMMGYVQVLEAAEVTAFVEGAYETSQAFNLTLNGTNFNSGNRILIVESVDENHNCGDHEGQLAPTDAAKGYNASSSFGDYYVDGNVSDDLNQITWTVHLWAPGTYAVCFCPHMQCVDYEALGIDLKTNSAVHAGTITISYPPFYATMRILTPVYTNQNEFKMEIEFSLSVVQSDDTTAAQSTIEVSNGQITLFNVLSPQKWQLEVQGDLSQSEAEASVQEVAVILHGDKIKEKTYPELGQDPDSGRSLQVIETDINGTLSGGNTAIFYVDVIPPTLTIVSPLAGACNRTRRNAPPPLMITSSETVTLTDARKIDVRNGWLEKKDVLESQRGAHFWLNGTDGATYVRMHNEGLVTVSVLANAALDEAGNANEAGNQCLFVFDETRPTVTLSIENPSEPATAEEWTFLLSFSEDMAPFERGNITCRNCTVITLESLDESSSQEYRVTALPDTEGTMSATISEGDVTDVAGNGNVAAEPIERSYTNNPKMTLDTASVRMAALNRPTDVLLVDFALKLTLTGSHLHGNDRPILVDAEAISKCELLSTEKLDGQLASRWMSYHVPNTLEGVKDLICTMSDEGSAFACEGYSIMKAGTYRMCVCDASERPASRCTTPGSYHNEAKEPATFQFVEELIPCGGCSFGFTCVNGECVPKCGDGILVTGIEVCDDGNAKSGDGCAGGCLSIEPGFKCQTTTVSFGDGQPYNTSRCSEKSLCDSQDDPDVHPCDASSGDRPPASLLVQCMEMDCSQESGGTPSRTTIGCFPSGSSFSLCRELRPPKVLSLRYADRSSSRLALSFDRPARLRPDKTDIDLCSIFDAQSRAKLGKNPECQMGDVSTQLSIKLGGAASSTTCDDLLAPGDAVAVESGYFLRGDMTDAVLEAFDQSSHYPPLTQWADGWFAAGATLNVEAYVGPMDGQLGIGVKVSKAPGVLGLGHSLDVTAAIQRSAAGPIEVTWQCVENQTNVPAICTDINSFLTKRGAQRVVTDQARLFIPTKEMEKAIEEADITPQSTMNISITARDCLYNTASDQVTIAISAKRSLPILTITRMTPSPLAVGSSAPFVLKAKLETSSAGQRPEIVWSYRLANETQFTPMSDQYELNYRLSPNLMSLSFPDGLTAGADYTSEVKATAQAHQVSTTAYFDVVVDDVPQVLASFPSDSIVAYNECPLLLSARLSSSDIPRGASQSGVNYQWYCFPAALPLPRDEDGNMEVLVRQGAAPALQLNVSLREGKMPVDILHASVITMRSPAAASSVCYSDETLSVITGQWSLIELLTDELPPILEDSSLNGYVVKTLTSAEDGLQDSEAESLMSTQVDSVVVEPSLMTPGGAYVLRYSWQLPDVAGVLQSNKWIVNVAPSQGMLQATCTVEDALVTPSTSGELLTVFDFSQSWTDPDDDQDTLEYALYISKSPLPCADARDLTPGSFGDMFRALQVFRPFQRSLKTRLPIGEAAVVAVARDPSGDTCLEGSSGFSCPCIDMAVQQEEPPSVGELTGLLDEAGSSLDAETLGNAMVVIASAADPANKTATQAVFNSTLAKFGEALAWIDPLDEDVKVFATSLRSVVEAQSPEQIGEDSTRVTSAFTSLLEVSIDGGAGIDTETATTVVKALDVVIEGRDAGDSSPDKVAREAAATDSLEKTIQTVGTAVIQTKTKDDPPVTVHSASLDMEISVVDVASASQEGFSAAGFSVPPLSPAAGDCEGDFTPLASDWKKNPYSWADSTVNISGHKPAIRAFEILRCGVPEEVKNLQDPILFCLDRNVSAFDWDDLLLSAREGKAEDASETDFDGDCGCADVSTRRLARPKTEPLLLPLPTISSIHSSIRALVLSHMSRETAETVFGAFLDLDTTGIIGAPHRQLFFGGLEWHGGDAADSLKPGAFEKPAESGNVTEEFEQDIVDSDCRYFDKEAQEWVTEGCSIVCRSRSTIKCACTHLTTFTAAAVKFTQKFDRTNIGIVAQSGSLINADMFSNPGFWYLWLVVSILLAPFIHLYRKDRKDYKRPNDRRHYFFRDAMAKGNEDFICNVLPPVGICNQLFMMPPVRINCSSCYRALTCYTCRRRKKGRNKGRSKLYAIGDAGADAAQKSDDGMARKDTLARIHEAGATTDRSDHKPKSDKGGDHKVLRFAAEEAAHGAAAAPGIKYTRTVSSSDRHIDSGKSVSSEGKGQQEEVKYWEVISEQEKVRRQTLAASLIGLRNLRHSRTMADQSPASHRPTKKGSGDLWNEPLVDIPMLRAMGYRGSVKDSERISQALSVVKTVASVQIDKEKQKARELLDEVSRQPTRQRSRMGKKEEEQSEKSETSPKGVWDKMRSFFGQNSTLTPIYPATHKEHPSFFALFIYHFQARRSLDWLRETSSASISCSSHTVSKRDRKVVGARQWEMAAIQLLRDNPESAESQPGAVSYLETALRRETATQLNAPPRRRRGSSAELLPTFVIPLSSACVRVLEMDESTRLHPPHDSEELSRLVAMQASLMGESGDKVGTSEEQFVAWVVTSRYEMICLHPKAHFSIPDIQHLIDWQGPRILLYMTDIMSIRWDPPLLQDAENFQDDGEVVVLGQNDKVLLRLQSADPDCRSEDLFHFLTAVLEGNMEIPEEDLDLEEGHHEDENREDGEGDSQTASTLENLRERALLEYFSPNETLSPSSSFDCKVSCTLQGGASKASAIEVECWLTHGGELLSIKPATSPAENGEDEAEEKVYSFMLRDLTPNVSKYRSASPDFEWPLAVTLLAENAKVKLTFTFIHPVQTQAFTTNVNLLKGRLEDADLTGTVLMQRHKMPQQQEGEGEEIDRFKGGSRLFDDDDGAGQDQDHEAPPPRQRERRASNALFYMSPEGGVTLPHADEMDVPDEEILTLEDPFTDSPTTKPHIPMAVASSDIRSTNNGNLPSSSREGSNDQAATMRAFNAIPDLESPVHITPERDVIELPTVQAVRDASFLFETPTSPTAPQRQSDQAAKQKWDKLPASPSSRGLTASQIAQRPALAMEVSPKNKKMTRAATMERFKRGDDPKHAGTETIAKQVQYQYWSPGRIFAKLSLREHPVPKLCPYSPAMNRVQRYSIFAVALFGGFFFSCLFFNVDCVTKPEAAACKKPSFWAPFIPNWEMLFASIWAVILSVPLPMLLRTLFIKQVFWQELTQKEKDFQIWFWRVKDIIAYTIVWAWITWCVYFLLLFVLSFDPRVYEKWMTASFWSLLHRNASAPLFRALFKGIILIISQFTSICDCYLLAFPLVIGFTDPLTEEQRLLDRERKRKSLSDEGLREDEMEDMGIDEGGGMEFGE
ncbi:unnamed protein product [Vitrella brassicaformis CCMP3155]|uniref:Bacterial Ig-like domain-containing protein n=1 Tax=Vitrella brassicaformis (strain CCMP3155) TaxID=1169540 RepID=A0A0G4FI03_VITBC|nr:unnamed protein product [Vitrella brassicaformis CCMP3155]|eukprot:CEM12961.1 unnamed protein product [Vitrella brassicaformis CCMP3155]